MLNPQALQLRVSVDVGSQCHSVAVGLTDGSLLEEFESRVSASAELPPERSCGIEPGNPGLTGIPQMASHNRQQ